VALPAWGKAREAGLPADNPFAVAVGLAKGRGKAGKTSYVLCHQPKSFDWRVRGAKAYSLGALPMRCLPTCASG